LEFNAEELHQLQDNEGKKANFLYKSPAFRRAIVSLQTFEKRLNEDYSFFQNRQLRAPFAGTKARWKFLDFLAPPKLCEEAVRVVWTIPK